MFPALPDAAGSARLSDAEIDELDRLLDTVPEPFESMDAAMVDGFLAGLAVLPQPVPCEQWLPHLFHTTPDPAAAPAAPEDVARVAALAERRLGFVRASLAAREPYDPILFALPDDAPQAGEVTPAQMLAPWAAGFANAMHAFPELTETGTDELAALLVGIYRHLPAEDQDAALRDLRAEAEARVPLLDLDDAIDDVMGCLMGIADLTQPRRPTVRAAPKVGRNDPCPCGSGRKFKQCHGRGG